MVLPEVVTEPHIVHGIPGRVRVHLPTWSGREPCALELTISQLPGVRLARANALTKNLLVCYDPSHISVSRILATATVWEERAAVASEDDGALGALAPVTSPIRALRPAPASVSALDAEIPGPRQTAPTTIRDARRAVHAAHDGRRVTPHRHTVRSDAIPRAHVLLDVARLALKAAGVIVGLLTVETPIGLVHVVIEAIRLLLEVCASRASRAAPAAPARAGYSYVGLSAFASA